MSYRIRTAKPADVLNLLALIHQKAEFDGCFKAVTATAEKLSHTLFTPPPMADVLIG